MKLIIQNNRISVVATDYYISTGQEQAVIDAPEDFDPARMDEYVYADGLVFVPVPTPEEELEAQKAAFTNAIQRRLDDFAATRMWDNAASCALRAESKIPQYRLEGGYMLDVMDRTWVTGTAIMNAVLAGERPMPTLEEVMDELPALAWPDEAADQPLTAQVIVQ